jgi:hypothetical protein
MSRRPRFVDVLGAVTTLAVGFFFFGGTAAALVWSLFLPSGDPVAALMLGSALSVIGFSQDGKNELGHSMGQAWRTLWLTTVPTWTRPSTDSDISQQGQGLIELRDACARWYRERYVPQPRWARRTLEWSLFALGCLDAMLLALSAMAPGMARNFSNAPAYVLGPTLLLVVLYALLVVRSRFIQARSGALAGSEKAVRDTLATLGGVWAAPALFVATCGRSPVEPVGFRRWLWAAVPLASAVFKLLAPHAERAVAGIAVVVLVAMLRGFHAFMRVRHQAESPGDVSPCAHIPLQIVLSECMRQRDAGGP